MCSDTTAYNIGRQSAAGDDRICCVWHVHNVVVGEMFKHGPSSGSIIFLLSFMTTGYKMIKASFILHMPVLKSL